MLTKGILKFIKEYLILIIALTVIFVLLKIFAYSLPGEMIKKNIEASIEQFEIEGTYPAVFYDTDQTEFSGQKLDNYTDAIFLDVAYNASDIPLLKAVVGDYRMVSEGETPVPQLINGIKNAKNGGTVEYGQYGRQWFGGEVIIRPLLLFFTYPQIRILLQTLVLGLLIAASVSLYRHIGSNAMIAFVGGLLCINLVIVSSSLNLVNGILVALIGAIVIPGLKNPISDDTKVIFIIGACTAYMDLFVAPLLTYTILAQVLLMKRAKKQQLLWKEGIFYLIKISLAWIAGYLTLWGMKWLLASIILSRNFFADALSEMRLFSAGYKPDWGPDSTLELMKEAVKLNFINLFPINIIVGSDLGWLVFGGGGIIIVILRIVRSRNINLSVNYIWISLVALAPYVWYLVVHSHSFVHYWFQYRIQAGTVIGIIFILLEGTEKKKLVGIK